MDTRQIRIEGMHCDNCVAAVTKALQAVGGQEVQVDLAAGTATVAGEHLPTVQMLVEAIENIGFDAYAD